MKHLLLVLAAALIHPGASHAQSFVDVARGVSSLQRTDPGPTRINALRINLCESGIRMHATAEADRGQRTSAWAAAQPNMVAAINGGFFFTSGFRPDGHAAGGRQEWTTSTSPASRGYFAFGRNMVAHARPGALPDWAEEAVNGDATLVLDGNVIDCGGCGGGRAPRTAIGHADNLRTIYLVVVDGRSSSSRGMTIDELAVLMGSFGVDRAMNLDGGGSSTMWVDGRGVVNRPSDGAERVVANHLGVSLNNLPAIQYNCTTGRRFAFRGSSFEGTAIRGVAGSVVRGELRFENLGSIGWGPRVSLAPLPRDVPSPFATSDWVSTSRVSTSPAGVTTNETTSFPFSVRIPDAIGESEMPMSMVFRNNSNDTTVWFGDSWGPRDGFFNLRVISEAPGDAGTADAGADASSSDAGIMMDAATGQPDATRQPDATIGPPGPMPDATVVDGSISDGEVRDGNLVLEGEAGGCSATPMRASGSRFLWCLLGVMFLVRRRARRL